MRELVAVAGTATSCASIDLGLEVYDTRRIEGHVLGRATLAALLDRLAALPLADRRQVTGLHPDRAPVIVPGIVILLEVLDAAGAGDGRRVGPGHPPRGRQGPRGQKVTPNRGSELGESGRSYDGDRPMPAGYS